MAWSLLASQHAGAANTFSTTAINTTGATLLIACWGESNALSAVLSDSKTNSWHTAKAYNPAGKGVTIAYAYAPTVSSGSADHTFTLTGSGIGASLQVYAFSGALATDPLDQSNQNVTFGGVTCTSGSVTPTLDGELIVTCDNADEQTSAMTIDSGFSTPLGDLGSGGVFIGSYSAWLAQTTAAAVNPTWTASGGKNHYVVIATFKPGAAGGPDLSALIGEPPCGSSAIL